MSKPIYFNQNISPSVLPPSEIPPKGQSQTIYYSNRINESLKRLEATQSATKSDVRELKGITQQITSQLKEFKNKTLNMLSNLTLGQKSNNINQRQNQIQLDSDFLQIRKELEQFKNHLEEYKTEQHKLIEEKFAGLAEKINDFTDNDEESIENIIKASDLQTLVLEDIVKRQSSMDHEFSDHLNTMKELLYDLKNENSEQNDIYLEYQKLHENLLHKIIEKQIVMEENQKETVDQF